MASRRYASSDRHGAEPAELVAGGLYAEHDCPGGLAGVFDELARGSHDAGDRALELVVVSAIELIHGVARACGCGLGRGLHEPVPGVPAGRHTFLSVYSVPSAGR